MKFFVLIEKMIIVDLKTMKSKMLLPFTLCVEALLHKYNLLYVCPALYCPSRTLREK